MRFNNFSDFASSVHSGKIPNGTDVMKSSMGLSDGDGKAYMCVYIHDSVDAWMSNTLIHIFFVI